MNHRIVVLGAGYAGAIAAGRLAKRLHSDDIDITIVNADTEFVERVRMHQLASGQDLPPRPLSEVYAGTGVQLRPARVAAVDPDRKSVDLITEHGADTLGYDTLVYALGSTVADHGVPGVTEYAHNVAGKQAALRLRTRLNQLKPGETVLVVGGGLTGIEAATEIAEAHPDLAVTIAARGGVGDWLSDKAQRHLRGVFERLAITVREHADITRVEADGVLTTPRPSDPQDATATTHIDHSTPTKIPAQVTVWTAGFTVHPIAAATTLAVSDTGQIIVDATMRSVSHPDVYAIGDAALATGATGKPLRMSCASGTQTAWLAADTLAARLTGRPIPENTIHYNLQCISLGRRDGIVQRVTADDEAMPTAITGRTAARIKEFICASAAWSIEHPTALLPSRRRHLTPSQDASDAGAQPDLATP